jgi:hypothetical protein
MVVAEDEWKGLAGLSAPLRVIKLLEVLDLHQRIGIARPTRQPTRDTGSNTLA